ncbi:BREX-1 system adenine-specific DNA-methyltransferase PglX [Sulfitobacter sp. M21595]|uniref:BREX-1 system adenine-specific DNA-methyltransferase PglX n=1 Tax=Sulfitobacter sp. M21595 TaxID=3368574 RepID=UPI003745282C
MDTNALKKFAAAARTLLIDQVSARLDVVLAEGASARREHPKAVKDLENAIARESRKQVIEQVAYTWFNRFTALRFMDVNGYTQVRVVSPAAGATRPEILSEAIAGHLPDGAPSTIQSLLDGRTPSHDPQAEAYRLLLVHACNTWHKHMPFLFEELDDYTELLMPEDLLSQTSILARLREVMTGDACRDVEIIGWLYQFYISEKKDQVFAGLKKNVKITAENIPAATQLFTPHWIVRYLVENSLGRLWLLNRPDSRLAERMDYYIAPEEPETDFLKITKPEEIRICDPAAGSGHMLTYAFDLLYAIYEEEGYEATEIPALILTHNLTGVEIDDRAGALAAFALAMKAAGKLGRRRFLRMEAKPDICVLQNVSFTDAEMQDVAAVVGKDLLTDELQETLGQFEQAKNFGSLIVPKLRDPAETLRVVEARDFRGDLLLKEVQERVVAVLRMAEALSPKYHVVVANPPYMGAKGMNPRLTAFLKTKYPEAKADLMTAFMVRNNALSAAKGFVAKVTLDSWMFLSTFEKLRRSLLSTCSIDSMVHVGWNCFPDGHVYNRGVAWVFSKMRPNLAGNYINLTDLPPTTSKGDVFLSPEIRAETLHSRSASDFASIPGMPVAYWLSDQLLSCFQMEESLGDLCRALSGMRTGDNDRFLRSWYEVSRDQLGTRTSDKSEKWFPYNKGGDFRKWYGNADLVVNWADDGEEIKELTRQTYPDLGENLSWKISNEDYYFRDGITWGGLSTAGLSFRWSDYGALFDSNKGAMMFPPEEDEMLVLSFLNSKVPHEILEAKNPTLSTQNSDINAIPFTRVGDAYSGQLRENTRNVLGNTRSDWDAYETSWDFTTLPLLSPDHRGLTLEATYARLRARWQDITDEMQRLEEENNRIFIDAYGLQDELSSEVPVEEITLTCNPAYRYGVKASEDDRETRLRADTMAEFLSYAVGCMFGRYSLDAPGLILANQGERLEDYLARIPEPRFMPDEDNVIPVLDADWFPDDITERFRLFLRVSFGEAHFRENLKFIENALGKDIRKYFTKDFYTDHVKRYKKRPIYWMVSSPKGTFNVLIYMHRYRGDTLSVLLNDYLREFISKLIAERERLEKLSDDPTAMQGQRTKALKEAGALAKQIDELNDWEREVIFPLAQQKIEIDLDDGVKHNYPLFGSALKKIVGLS